MTLIITVPGRPSPKGSLKHVGHGRLVEQLKASKPWRQAVADATRQAVADLGWQTTTGPVIVTADILIPHLKTRRAWPVTRSSGDLDKHARNILDALVDGGAIHDDSQVVALHFGKVYADEPGAVVWVEGVG